MNATTFGFAPQDFDPSILPDFDKEFINEEDIDAFIGALQAPDAVHLASSQPWTSINYRADQRVPTSRSRRRRKEKSTWRSRDEIREGYVYSFFKWPLLVLIFGWIICLGALYWATRLYVSGYERFVTWRGRRKALRDSIRSKKSYDHWKIAAQELDLHLGNEAWKRKEEYAYYDYLTIKQALEQLRRARSIVQRTAKHPAATQTELNKLQSIVEACVKNNFMGVENPRLYSETYIGTKTLAQDFIDEVHESLIYLFSSNTLSTSSKHALAQRLHANYGRTALCLSGGASFAWYHFGVVKALLDSDLLPQVITGTSGGALVAALVATRTDEELKALLVPALSHKITACEEPYTRWLPRWWKTGARFDSVQWASKCSWFARGLTFREAYERTGRVLNVSCVPSDPHSPTILTNVVTAPDCVIWSAVLASAAVPGILNPVTMMSKRSDGKLVPFSFGNKWKDGSLRTDIPLKALNLHFGVTFSVVCQVNPHVNAFFYASKGTVGRPVTHRRGRGWRGGYLGSALETYLKLELQKFLKMLRHLELLPRLLGQDWSGIWLQQFSGTITIWPKSHPSDFWLILSDPSSLRLARMMLAGQQSAWSKLLFIANRMKIERCIERGLGKDGEFAASTQTRGIDRAHVTPITHMNLDMAELSTDTENGSGLD